MGTYRELDERVPFRQQLAEPVGPVTFFNTFHVAQEDVEAFLSVWKQDGEIMKRQPGFISTQLYRGIAGSTTFINMAVWQSVEAMRNAVSSPDFQASLGRYPKSATASPHLFAKVAVPGICQG